MNKHSKKNDELDLIETFIILSKSKYKILFITFLFLVFTFVYQITKVTKVKEYKITTEIDPISIVDESKYFVYNYNVRNITNNNNLGISKTNQDDSVFNNQNSTFNSLSAKITKEYLLHLFVDKFQDRSLLIEAIKKHNLVRKEDFKNTTNYNIAILKIADSIIISEGEIDTKTKMLIDNKRVEFKTTKPDLWISFLNSINKTLTEEVRLHLIDKFNQLILNEKKLKKFKIEDIDLEIKIALETYDRRVENKIAFLKEQASIAKKLNISKTNINSILIETQTYTSNSGVLSNIKREVPYYLRGYESIEKEIDLIMKRKNKEKFIDEINILLKKRKQVSDNKSIERIEENFSQTPVFKKAGFLAANMKIYSSSIISKVDPNKNKILKTLIAGILGLMISIIYVLISHSIRNRI